MRETPEEERLYLFNSTIKYLATEFANKVYQKTGVAVDLEELLEMIFEVNALWRERDRLERATGE